MEPNAHTMERLTILWLSFARRRSVFARCRSASIAREARSSVNVNVVLPWHAARRARTFVIARRRTGRSKRFEQLNVIHSMHDGAERIAMTRERGSVERHAAGVRASLAGARVQRSGAACG
jgi:hypothetical protein